MAPAAPVMHLLLTKTPPEVWEPTRALCGADASISCTVGEEGTRWPLHSPSQHSSDAASMGHPARARQALPAKELAHLLRSTSAITFLVDPQATPPSGPPSKILPSPPDQYQSPSSLALKSYLCAMGPTGNQDFNKCQEHRALVSETGRGLPQLLASCLLPQARSLASTLHLHCPWEEQILPPLHTHFILSTPFTVISPLDST